MAFGSKAGALMETPRRHWLAAQREVLSASLGTFARVSVNEPGVPKTSAKQRKAKSKKAQVAA